MPNQLICSVGKYHIKGQVCIRNLTDLEKKKSSIGYCSVKEQHLLCWCLHMSVVDPSYQILFEVPFLPISFPFPIELQASGNLLWYWEWLPWPKRLHCLLWPSWVLTQCGTVASCCAITYLDVGNLLPWEDFLSTPTFLLIADLCGPHQTPGLQLHWGVWSLWYLLRTNNSTMFWHHCIFLGKECFCIPGVELQFSMAYKSGIAK